MSRDATPNISKRKNPKYQEAFKRLREIMRAELQEYNFKNLKDYVNETVREKTLFSLTPDVLDKIVAGQDDYRTEEVLIICSEYLRNALIKRNKKSRQFDNWVKEYASSDDATPTIEIAAGGQKPLTGHEQVAPANGSSFAVNEEESEQSGGSAISWLYRYEQDGSTATSEVLNGWPVSFAAAIGLDRTAQTAICVGCNARTLLNELLRVEAVLKSVDKAGQFTSRTWSVENGWLAESATEASIIDLSASELIKISRDTVEGVVQRHFERHSGNPASSMVLIIPASAASAAQRVANVLSGSVGPEECLSVDLLRSFNPTVNDRNLRRADADFMGLIFDADAMKDTYQVLTRARTPRLQNLLQWLNGETSDENFFGRLTSRDLRLVICSGRLGLGNDRPSPNAIHRSVALIRAAADNQDLLYALGSLPVEPEIVEQLIRSPIHVRAVAGLITKDEMMAVPAPWFQKPIDTWRHGRGLKVRRGQKGWVQAVS